MSDNQEGLQVSPSILTPPPRKRPNLMLGDAQPSSQLAKHVYSASEPYSTSSTSSMHSGSLPFGTSSGPDLPAPLSLPPGSTVRKEPLTDDPFRKQSDSSLGLGGAAIGGMVGAFADPLARVNTDFETDHIHQVMQLLQSFRCRQTMLMNECQALRQDRGRMTIDIRQKDEALHRERDALQSAYALVADLQGLIAGLAKGLDNTKSLKDAFHSKCAMIEDLLMSIRDQKSKMMSRFAAESKIHQDTMTNLRKEKDSIAQRLGSAEEETMKLSERLSELITENNSANCDRALLQERLGDAQKALQNLKGQYDTITLSMEELRKDKDLELEQIHNLLMDLLTDLSSKLKCRPPVSFGNFSSEALKVVTEEIVGEHYDRLKANDLDYDQKIQTLQEQLRFATSSGGEAQSQITCLQEELCLIKRDKETLLAEKQTLKSLTEKYEARIAEQHKAHCQAMTKLADHQQLKVFANAFNEKVLDGHGKDMEYEDMILLLEEKLGHSACLKEISSLKSKVKDLEIAYENARSSAERLKLSEMEKEKKSVVQLEALKVENERLKIKASTTLTAEAKIACNQKHQSSSQMDKTVEGLIQLIEKDTQEVNKKGSSNVTPLAVISGEKKKSVRSRNRTTKSNIPATPSIDGNTPRAVKRSPKTIPSELDLWSVFAKRK